MINIQQVRDTIHQIFSSDGYTKNNIKVKFPELFKVKMQQVGDDIIVDFDNESLPYISWHRLLTLSAYIHGIVLGKDGGTVKLKYLPDITFAYDKTQELINAFSEDNFGSTDFSDIENEIYSEYKDETRQKLALLCLQYGIAWSKIASQSCDFNCTSRLQRRKMKQQCSDFIKDNVLNGEDKKYGSVVLSFLLIYVLLPVILKFIVEKIFRKLFE